MTRDFRLGPPTLLITAVLALGGCSSDSADADAPESDAPQATSDNGGDTGAPSEPDPQDQRIAEAALLTLKDFPAGWEAVAPEDEDDERAGQEKIAECVGVEYDDLYDDTNAEATSPDFTNELEEELSVTVSVGDEDRSERAFEIATRPEFRECLAEGMNDEIKANAEADSSKGVEVGDVSVNELSFPSLGDESLAFRMTIPISASGLDLDAVIDFVGVRVGRAQTHLTSFGVGTQLSTDEFVRYARLAANRLESKLAGT